MSTEAKAAYDAAREAADTAYKLRAMAIRAADAAAEAARVAYIAYFAADAAFAAKGKIPK